MNFKVQGDIIHFKKAYPKSCLMLILNHVPSAQIQHISLGLRICMLNPCMYTNERENISKLDWRAKNQL